MSAPQSKWKNALGEDRKEKFLQCAVSTVSTEGRLLAVNSNFLAKAWNNIGEIVVVDSSNPCSIKPDQPRFKGHRSNVLDLQFCPHSTDLLACLLTIAPFFFTESPRGLTQHITKEVQLYHKYQKKVPFLTFNSIASDVLCSSALGGEIHIWNALKGETFCEINGEDIPT